MAVDLRFRKKPFTALFEEARVQVLAARQELALRGLHRRPLSKSAFLRREKENAGSAEVCHILGSGWSLNDSIASIPPSHYVVGYNMAALTGVVFDSYHMERIDERKPGVNEFYRAMIDGSGQNRVHIKNMYEHRALVRVVNAHIDHGATPYKTFGAGGYFPKGHERALCNYLLDGGGRYLLQYKSSLMLFVVAYALAGFRQIVLHGQDLSGPYFFDVAEYPLARELDPRACGILPREVPDLVRPHQIDQAFRDEPRIVDVLPALVGVLEERGVALTCASAKSPIARFCPVYQSV